MNGDSYQKIHDSYKTQPETEFDWCKVRRCIRVSTRENALENNNGTLQYELSTTDLYDVEGNEALGVENLGYRC